MHPSSARAPLRGRWPPHGRRATRRLVSLRLRDPQRVWGGGVSERAATLSNAERRCVSVEPPAGGQSAGFADVLRLIADGAPNAVVAVDAQGNVAFINAKAATLFGYHGDELVGRPIEVLLPERLRDDHIAHRREFLGRPQARPMGIGLELAGRRHDGTEFPVEISLTPVEGPTGRVVMATVVDITARKQIETALAESEGRFRAVLEASPNAIVAIDEAGTMIYVNPQVEKTFG